MTYSISYKDKDWLRCRESVTQSAYFNGTHKFWDLPVCLYLSKAADNNSMPENDFFWHTACFIFSEKNRDMDKFWQWNFGSVRIMTIPPEGVSRKQMLWLVDAGFAVTVGGYPSGRRECVWERKMGTNGEGKRKTRVGGTAHMAETQIGVSLKSQKKGKKEWKLGTG